MSHLWCWYKKNDWLTPSMKSYHNLFYLYFVHFLCDIIEYFHNHVCTYIFSCLDFLKDNHWKRMKFLGVLVMMVLLGNSINAYGAINQLSWREISNINNQGPYIGIIVPNAYELNPLLLSSSFEPHNKFPYFDFAGKFHNNMLFNYLIILVYIITYAYDTLFLFMPLFLSKLAHYSFWWWVLVVLKFEMLFNIIIAIKF